MRYTVGTQFRTQTKAPTEEGWYYCRAQWQGARILPTRVYGDSFNGLFVREGEHNKRDLNEFDWFGPVDEVREASSG